MSLADFIFVTLVLACLAVLGGMVGTWFAQRANNRRAYQLRHDFHAVLPRADR